MLLSADGNQEAEQVLKLEKHGTADGATMMDELGHREQSQCVCLKHSGKTKLGDG